jgi:hypothetical protein
MEPIIEIVPVESVLLIDAAVRPGYCKLLGPKGQGWSKSPPIIQLSSAGCRSGIDLAGRKLQ